MKMPNPGGQAGAGGSDDRQDVTANIAQPDPPDNQPPATLRSRSRGSAIAGADARVPWSPYARRARGRLRADLVGRARLWARAAD